MDTSPNLALPYIAPSQAQKHVTHNEAIRALDALVQLAVIDRTRTAPPIDPFDGHRHIVGADAEEEWAGRDGQIAAFQDGAWTYFNPGQGWIAFVMAEEQAVSFDGTGWQPLVSLPDILPQIGLNTGADGTNRLAVRADAALFTHESGSHQIKINKETAADTASVLFQTNFSGRAEFGLAGTDAFSLKVSADGSSWFEPILIDGATGHVGIATTPTTALHVNGAIRVQSYSAASLPSPSDAGSGAMLHVYDEAGGSVIAFSDGGTWRRMTDREPVT